jgi:hypothetical protein
MRTSTTNYKGRIIFYMDFSDLKAEAEIKEVLDESKAYIRRQPMASVYGLANIEEMHFNNTIKEYFLEFVKGNKPYMKASTIVGVTGLKQILFNGIMKMTGRDVKSCNSISQAKEWLVSQK